MKKNFFHFFCWVLLAGLLLTQAAFTEKEKVKSQKYQLAVYFETWDRIFIALTVPGLESSDPLTQDQFEQVLKEFDGDKSKVVVTLNKVVVRDEYYLADEYKLEKLLKKFGFKEIVFKKAQENAAK